MPYRLLKGNLITMFKAGDFDAIIHGCNCYNIMGAGFAKQIKQNFPRAFEVDRDFYIKKGIHRLGNYSYCRAEVNNDRLPIIINAYTQYQTGKCFDINALEKVLTSSGVTDEVFKDSKIAVPGLIGCGIGGGNPKEVLELLDKSFPHGNLYIVYPH